MSALSYRIRRIRQKLRLTQAEAAARLFVAQSTWSKWERGSMVPSKLRRAAIYQMGDRR